MEGQLQRHLIRTPISVGVLLNRNSRLNREDSWEDQAQELLSPEKVKATSSIQEIDAALRSLFLDQKINVLAICGGDGTLHHTLNALFQLSREHDLGFGLGALPPVLVLRGGTMNILAGSLKFGGKPVTILKRFLQRYEKSVLGEIPLTQVPFLCVESQRWGPRLGFVFGSSLTVVCLELYDHRFGGGFRGLWKFLQEVVTSYMFKTPFWMENKHWLEGPAGTVSLDRHNSEYLGLVASTIDISLMQGWVKGLAISSELKEDFQTRILDPMTPAQVVGQLPKLLFGRPGKGIRDFVGVKEMMLDGDFSLDGELYQFGETKETVRVYSPARKLTFVKPFLAR